MSRVRRCDSRCHRAQGNRCKCWCGGFYHGSAGVVNREALVQAATEADRLEILGRQGFKEGETAYIEQKELSLKLSRD